MLSEKVRLRLVVAVCGAILLSLEILGSRVLAPAFGSSVFVWGGLITTFLVALAVGYAVGGWVADRRPRASTLSLILSVAAVLVLPAERWAPRLLDAITRAGWDARSGALVASLVLFLPPSLALGMVSPFAVRLAVRDVERVGTVSGGYSALSTAGSIAGTLATAFVLIPLFPVPELLSALAATLALCALILVRNRSNFAIAALATLTCGAAWVAGRPAAGVGGEKVLFARDTAYHHIVVTELDRNRFLRFDTGTQSGVRLDHPGKSLVGYDEAFFAAFAMRPAIKRVCLIGLGGASFNRMLAEAAPETNVDGVEIDPVVRDVAKKYFLYRESARDRTTVEDGRVFLSKGGAPYDLIVLDAYNSTGVPFHLLTREFFQTLRSRLSPEGVFVANLVGKVMGRDSRLFWASYRTIRRQFGQVYVMNSEIAAGKPSFSGNLILLATASADPVATEELARRGDDLARKWRLALLPRWLDTLVHSPDPPYPGPELTDRYAPVEALQSF